MARVAGVKKLKSTDILEGGVYIYLKKFEATIGKIPIFLKSIA